MHKRWLVLFVGIALSLALAACTCNPTALSSQSVTLRGQENSNWCWAASGQMVMSFLGNNVAQCTQANQRLSRSDCCNGPLPGGCNTTGWPEFAANGFRFDRTSNAPLSWADVRSQIHCAKKPFAFSWHWPGGGGHMMVVYGYATINNVNYVSVYDPLPVGTGTDTVYTYDYYNTSAGHHTHWDDFYNVTRED